MKFGLYSSIANPPMGEHLDRCIDEVIAEAEAIYRSDLGLDGKLSRACQHPDNLWSLHGLHECLTRRGETVEAALIKQRLDLAQARSEVPVKASCFCRMNVAA